MSDAAGKLDILSALATFCELDPPQVSGQLVSDGRNAHVQRLISLGALKPSGCAEIITCPACDEPHDVAIEIDDGGSYSAFCPEAGFQLVSPEALRLYRVDFDWLVAGIAGAVSARPPAAARVTDEPLLYRIGQARFRSFKCHLFFARRLFDRARLETAVREVLRVASDLPPIVVTSTPIDRLAGGASPRCGFVEMTEVIWFNGARLAVDEEPIRALLTGKTAPVDGVLGFSVSPGFRTATFEGVTYHFSDKQALVFEELHNAWTAGSGPRHTKELQGAADTPQRIGQLFRNHPAYGSLIRHDSRGHYWLAVGD